MTNVNLYSKEQIEAKYQPKPAAAGTSGQVLKLDANLDPIWANESGGSSPNKVDIFAAAKSRIIGLYDDIGGGTHGQYIEDDYSIGEIAVSGSSDTITVFGQTVSIKMSWSLIKNLSDVMIRQMTVEITYDSTTVTYSQLIPTYS